jgi:hypothetical protein
MGGCDSPVTGILLQAGEPLLINGNWVDSRISLLQVTYMSGEKTISARGNIRAAVSCFLVALVLLLSVAATSPALHRALHGQDAHLGCSGSCLPLGNETPVEGEAKLHCPVLLLMAGTFFPLPVEAPPVAVRATGGMLQASLACPPSNPFRCYDCRAPPLRV